MSSHVPPEMKELLGAISVICENILWRDMKDLSQELAEEYRQGRKYRDLKAIISTTSSCHIYPYFKIFIKETYFAAEGEKSSNSIQFHDLAKCCENFWDLVKKTNAKQENIDLVERELEKMHLDINYVSRQRIDKKHAIKEELQKIIKP